VGAFFYKIRQYILEDYEAKIRREGGREGGKEERLKEDFFRGL